MALIRRAGPRGRLNPAKRLAWIKENRGGAEDEARWERFLVWVLPTWIPGAYTVSGYVFFPPEFRPAHWVHETGVGARTSDGWFSPWAVDFAEAFALVPPSPKDKMLPWLWTEHTFQMAAAVLKDLTEWYEEGARRHRAPDLTKLTLVQALREARDWRREVKARKLAEDIHRTFSSGGSSGSGWEWRSYSHELDPDYVSLKAVGRTLQHCYEQLAGAVNYARDYEMMLLSVEGVPKVMAAFYPDGRIKDILGIQNAEPRQEFWPQISALLRARRTPLKFWGAWRYRDPEHLAHLKDLMARAETDDEAAKEILKLPSVGIPPEVAKLQDLLLRRGRWGHRREEKEAALRTLRAGQRLAQNWLATPARLKAFAEFSLEGLSYLHDTEYSAEMTALMNLYLIAGTLHTTLTRALQGQVPNFSWRMADGRLTGTGTLSQYGAPWDWRYEWALGKTQAVLRAGESGRPFRESAQPTAYPQIELEDKLRMTARTRTVPAEALKLWTAPTDPGQVHLYLDLVAVMEGRRAGPTARVIQAIPRLIEIYVLDFAARAQELWSDALDAS